MAVTKYTYLEKLVKQVRKLLPMLLHQQIMRGVPQVSFNEDFQVNCFYWSYYDYEITVYSTGIVINHKGHKVTLFTYDSFDELLKL